MMEVLNFIFGDFWHFVGVALIAYILRPRVINKFEMSDAEFSNKAEISAKKTAFWSTKNHNIYSHDTKDKQ